MLDLFAYKHNYGTNDVTAEVPFQVTVWGEEGVVGVIMTRELTS